MLHLSKTLPGSLLDALVENEKGSCSNEVGSIEHMKHRFVMLKINRHEMLPYNRNMDCGCNADPTETVGLIATCNFTIN